MTKKNFNVLQTISSAAKSVPECNPRWNTKRNNLTARVSADDGPEYIGSGATVAKPDAGATTLKLTEKTGSSMRRYRAIHVRVKRFSLEINEPMISTTARVGGAYSASGAGKINEFLINRPQSYQDALRSSTWPICSVKRSFAPILLLRITNSSYNQSDGYLVSVLIAVLVVTRQFNSASTVAYRPDESSDLHFVISPAAIW